MAENKKFSKMGFAFLVGAITGYIGSLFVSDKTKKKHKYLVKSLSKALADPDERARVKEVFDKYTTESAQTYRQTKKELIKCLSELGAKLKDVDLDEYISLVNQSIKTVTKKKELPIQQVNKLQQLLQNDFAKLKQTTQENES